MSKLNKDATLRVKQLNVSYYDKDTREEVSIELPVNINLTIDRNTLGVSSVQETIIADELHIDDNVVPCTISIPSLSIKSSVKIRRHDRFEISSDVLAINVLSVVLEYFDGKSIREITHRNIHHVHGRFRKVREKCKLLELEFEITDTHSKRTKMIRVPLDGTINAKLSDVSTWKGDIIRQSLPVEYGDLVAVIRPPEIGFYANRVRVLTKGTVSLEGSGKQHYRTILHAICYHVSGRNPKWVENYERSFNIMKF